MIYWDLDGVLRPRPEKTRYSIELALKERGINIKISKKHFDKLWNKISSEAKKTNQDVYFKFIQTILDKDFKEIEELAKRAKEIRNNIKNPEPFYYSLEALKLLKDSGLKNTIITHSYGAKDWIVKNKLNKIIDDVIDNVEIKNIYFSEFFIYIGDQKSDIEEYKLAKKSGKKGILYIVGNIYNYKDAIYLNTALEVAQHIVKNI